MDELDQKILNRMQKGLDITENPFHEIAEEIGIETQDLIERLARIKEEGYIRRIGAIFNTGEMGYKSILLAMKVPDERVYEVAKIINENEGVTHNYRRDNSLNIWFTLSTRNEEEKKQILGRIIDKSGIDKIYEFPSSKKFKINVFFDMECR